MLRNVTQQNLDSNRLFERNFYVYVFMACIYYIGKCLIWKGICEYEFHIHE